MSCRNLLDAHDGHKSCQTHAVVNFFNNSVDVLEFSFRPQFERSDVKENDTSIVLCKLLKIVCAQLYLIKFLKTYCLETTGRTSLFQPSSSRTTDKTLQEYAHPGGAFREPKQETENERGWEWHTSETFGKRWVSDIFSCEVANLVIATSAEVWHCGCQKRQMNEL